MMEPIRSFGMGTSSDEVWGDAVGASVLGKDTGAMAAPDQRGMNKRRTHMNMDR